MDNGDKPIESGWYIDKEVVEVLKRHRGELGLSMQNISSLSKRVIGLTKREYFASKQMAAIQSASMKGYIGDDSGINHIAEVAVKQADALLKALEKGGKYEQEEN